MSRILNHLFDHAVMGGHAGPVMSSLRAFLQLMFLILEDFLQGNKNFLNLWLCLQIEDTKKETCNNHALKRHVHICRILWPISL